MTIRGFYLPSLHRVYHCALHAYSRHYRVNHKFGNALFCWLRVSWWKRTTFSLLKWKVHVKASKWYQFCFGALSNNGADDIWVDKKKLKTLRVKLQFLRWLQNPGFSKICFSILFSQFDYINRIKLMKHIFSLTERFWKQWILLNNKANFCDRKNFS